MAIIPFKEKYKKAFFDQNDLPDEFSHAGQKTSYF